MKLDDVKRVLRTLQVLEIVSTCGIVLGLFAIFICGCPKLMMASVAVRLVLVPLHILVVRKKREMEGAMILEA